MKLKTLTEYKIQDYRIKFESIKLLNGKKIMGIVTDNGKKFAIEASRNNYYFFKDWPKGTEKDFIEAELKPTFKTIKTIDGDKLKTVKIRTEFDLNTLIDKKKDLIF